MDLEKAEAMRKLLKQSEPVRVLRRKYELASLSEELGKVEKVLKVRPKKSLIWKLFPPDPPRILLEKAERLREDIKKIENDWIEGVLTPITEMERWECLHEYNKVRHFLSMKSAQQELSEEARKSEQYSIDTITNQIYIAAQVECSLKRRAEGNLVRYFLPGQTSTVDPRVLSEIFMIYQKAFVLSETEIKK